MSEDTDKTIILAGRVVGFIHPTQGQIEALIRISHTLQTGTDDDNSEFWIKQIRRIGTLLDALIAPADQELVEDLYLTGKISHSDLLTAIMTKVNAKVFTAPGLNCNPYALARPMRLWSTDLPVTRTVTTP